MKKKKIQNLAACLLLLPILAGCSSSYVENNENSQAQNHTEEQTELKAENLTEKIGIGMNLDYSHQSMEPVQAFGYSLLGQNLKEKNPVLSPVSAYIALSMAGKGAGGNTMEEIKQILDSDMMCIPDELMNNLPKHSEELEIAITNSVWLDDDFKVNDEWLGTISSLFDAEAYRAALDTEETKNDINFWVNKNTNGMIPKLLEETLPSDRLFELINTLYFKADWQQKFEAGQTSKGEFTTIDGKTITTDMMHKYLQYCDYIETKSAEGIVLPYADGSYSFVALKPKDASTIRDIYADLTINEIVSSINKKKDIMMNLTLPKFEVTFDKLLNESLHNMGMKKAFDPYQADLSKIGTASTGENLYISVIRQISVVKVDEDGTEAAAVTEIGADAGAAIVDDPLELSFDQPFFYMIVHMETGAPLFVGIMDEP